MTVSLQKITTEFNQPEDRIKLTGVAGDGSQVAIWLTRRLLQRLLPVLLNRLGKDVALVKSPQPAVAQAAVQSFAQQSARASLTAQKPVVQNVDTATWLAESVEVSSSASKVTITFTCPDGRAAEIPMSNQVLRQWLGIVYDKYRSAEWPLDIWPAWLIQSHSAKAVPQGALH